MRNQVLVVVCESRINSWELAQAPPWVMVVRITHRMRNQVLVVVCESRINSWELAQAPPGSWWLGLHTVLHPHTSYLAMYILRVRDTSLEHLFCGHHPTPGPSAPLKVPQVRQDPVQALLLEAEPLTQRMPHTLPARRRDDPSSPRV